MRKDIYVVQKNEQEGKQLEEWCKEQGLPIEGLCLSFVEGNYNRQDDWICFYYNKNEQAFRKNEELKKCINLKQVTIEEFKRLQLESLGKIETSSDEWIPKEGDLVYFNPETWNKFGNYNLYSKIDFNKAYEVKDYGNYFFENCKGSVVNIDEIYQGAWIPIEAVMKSSNLKPVEEKFITGKWYKILDNWWAKFKTVHNSGNRWQFSEHIDKNGAYSNIIQSIDVISEIKLLTDLSEIQEYLPLNHSDLIVKNICPEYVEYIDTKYKGQIVRVTEWSSANYCKIHHPIDGILKPFKDLVKPSTQEAFNKQSDSNKGFIVGEWYTCSCNDCYFQFHSIQNGDITTSAVINPTNKRIAGVLEIGYTEEVTGGRVLSYFSPDKKAPLDVVNKFLPKKYDYEVVHCKTQEEGITMENTYYIKVNNQEQLDELIQDFKQQGYENSNREITFKSTFFIVYPAPKQFQLLSDNCGYPEKQWEFKKSNESLVGRWVKRISYLTYPAFWVQIGQYDLIEADNNSSWLLKTFKNCAKEYLLKDFELMPEGFNPNEVVKPSLDFNQLNIEDWLRETKKLNLSLEELDKHISSSATCNHNKVYLKLKGNTLEQKAEILWNEWNKPEIDKTDFIVSIPDEWGQNKYVIGIDPYNLIEEFKPNTQATLIPVKQKQIFKN